MDKQRTIVNEVSLEGNGIHTANPAKIIFKPAEADSGVTFIRTDLAGKPAIKACLANLLSSARSPRRTSVGNQAAEVQTIEHLMASLCGLSIDNLYVEINNNEIPGLDGSSEKIMEVLACAGIREQDRPRKYFAIKEPIFVEEEGASIMAVPSSEFKISYTLNYSHRLLGTQFMELTLGSEAFKKEISSARTFCLEEEVRHLQEQGLGKGANYENTLVVGENGIIKNKLRYENEFIRHKILDLIGDLYVLGYPIKGHIIALRSGHALNLKLAAKIEQQREKYARAGIEIGYLPKENQVLDAKTIMQILPHRPPFLFVDRITFLERGKRAVGIKNVTNNDYFFQGHFPGRPVMPGVLIIEAMAQVGGVMMLSPEQNRGKIAYFMAANDIKFRKVVVPGAQLVFEVEAGRIKSRTGQVYAKALVDGKVVAEAELMFALAD